MTGALPATAAPAGENSRKAPNGGRAESVLIIGAGVAGLRAARLLLDQGYSVEVIEALDRPGGRNFTARAGDKVIEQASGAQTTSQTCTFDDGLYLNLGPGRIPYHHRRVLDLCQRLNVDLEPYIMETTANRFAGIAGRSQPNRQIANDTRGHLAALLHQAVKKGALSAELAALSPAQQDNLLDLLAVFGDLDATKDFGYTGTTRSGYRVPLSVTDLMQPPTPVGLGDLVDARFWQHQFYHPLGHLWQATMFQPIGGMDMVVRALVADLPADVITYSDPVTSVEILPDGVRVRTSTGERIVNYCLSNMPLPVLHNQVSKVGFSDEFQKAAGTLTFDPACKVGWQANKRFWETDKYQIYGGISWTDDIIQQVWYPSNDYFSEKGTMTGAYNFDEDAIKLGEMPLQERLDTARQSATRLHPEFGDTSIVPDNGMSIAWHKVPYQSGVSAHWSPSDVNAAFAYSRLLAPDTPSNRRFFVIGDQVSPLPGWQEGALMSAEYVVGQLLGTERSEPPVIHQVPDSRAIRP
ncbi:flavin monoamine oxidase family protein [Actinophytocola sediminis]